MSTGPTYTGHEVIDVNGDTVGTVTDVIFDDRGNEPSWLVVDTGLFRKERLVPIEGSYETDDGSIMVPFDKRWIKQAPAVDGDHTVAREIRQHAAQHFDVTA